MAVPPRKFPQVTDEQMAEKLRLLSVENPDRIDNRDYFNLWTAQSKESERGSDRQADGSL